MAASSLIISLAAVLSLAARPAVAPEALSSGEKAALQAQLSFVSSSESDFGQWDAGNELKSAVVTPADGRYELEFACGCGNEQFQFWPKTWDARVKSNTMAATGDSPGTVRPFSNLWWVWGQFVIHDMLSTVRAHGAGSDGDLSSAVALSRRVARSD